MADEITETPDEPTTADEPEAGETVPEAVAEAAASEAVAGGEAEASADAEPAAEAEAPAPAEAAPVAEKKKRKRIPRPERRQRSKPAREQVDGRKPITRLEKPERERGRSQERRGVVVSSAMDKTIVVRVETLKAHRKYKKIIRRSTKFHAHDESNEAKVGDVVRIVETRPLSKTKRWRLAEIVEEAK